MKNANEYFNEAINNLTRPKKLFGYKQGTIYLPSEDMEATSEIILTPRIGVAGFDDNCAVSMPAIVANFGEELSWLDGEVLAGISRYVLKTKKTGKGNTQNHPNGAQFKNLVIRKSGVIIGGAQTTCIDGLTCHNYSRYSEYGLYTPPGSHSYKASRLNMIGLYSAGKKKTKNRKGVGIRCDGSASYDTAKFHHNNFGFYAKNAVWSLHNADFEHVNTPFRIRDDSFGTADHCVIHNSGKTLLDLRTRKRIVNRNVDISFVIYSQPQRDHFYLDHKGKERPLCRSGDRFRLINVAIRDEDVTITPKPFTTL